MVTFPAGYDLLILPGLEICEMPLIPLTSGAFIAFQLDQQFNNANKIDSLIISHKYFDCCCWMDFLVTFFFSFLFLRNQINY